MGLPPFIPRTSEQPRLDFTTLPDGHAIIMVKQYLCSRLRRGTPGTPGQPGAGPLKLTDAYPAFCDIRAVLRTLRGLGVARLADVTQQHLDTALRQWKTGSLNVAASNVAAVKNLAAHSAFLTGDRLSFSPWLGRTASSVAGLARGSENSTERIPETIIGPLLKAAVFYVQTASADLITARRMLEDLEAARAGQQLSRGQARARLDWFIAARRDAGRGLPAVPFSHAPAVPGVPVRDGVIQAANRTFICLLAGIRTDSSVRQILSQAGEELAMSPAAWAAPGRHGRRRAGHGAASSTPPACAGRSSTCGQRPGW